MKESTVASDGYLGEVRGIAVGQDGQIFVTTQACRQGAVVSVDPDTGTQTPIALGFRTAMGIAVAPDGKSLLVGDENPQAGRWGTLIRVDLETRQQTEEAVFRVNSAARSVAVDPNPPNIYVADGPVSRIESQGSEPIQVTVDGLEKSFAMAISPAGDISIGEHERGTILLILRGTRAPISRVQHSELNQLWAIALSNDGKALFLAIGANMGAVFRLNVPFDGKAPVPVWKGKRAGGPVVAVAVVGKR